MRWPFGPPHLTLKPSKKKHKNTKTQKQKKNKENNKKKQKNKKKKKPKKNSKNTPKLAFQLSIKFFFFFWVAFQNFPFLTPWPRKCAPKKYYKNRGFRAFFVGGGGKQMCVTKRPFLDQKKQNS